MLAKQIAVELFTGIIEMNTEQLIKAIARHALDHGHLHLGELTLLDLICADLGVSKDELKQVEQHLKETA